jgi:ribA/ribD-fused uncharacterized protein
LKVFDMSGIFDCAETDMSKWFDKVRLHEDFYFEGVPIISQFRGEYRWLSNFHITIIPDKSTEHFFQAAKAKKDAEGLEWKKRILDSEKPSDAKKLGGKVPLRDDWHDVKMYAMALANSYKFMGSFDLYKMLMKTGNSYLIEGNVWHDNFWGLCIKKDCPRCSHVDGKNMLGNTLMAVRGLLKEEVQDKANGDELLERQLLKNSLDNAIKEEQQNGIL